jgi:hypothetical protein
MDAQDFRSLQEAYMEVVENQQLDEISIGDRARNAVADDRLDAEQERTNTSMNRLRQQNNRFARVDASNAARKVERDVRKSNAYGPQRPKPGTVTGRRIEGPKPTGSKPTGYRIEGTDIYDIILSHLLDEGYAETPEAAEAIMVNMSEEWRDSIVEERVPVRKRGGISAPEDERSIGGEANRRNKDYWASVIGKNRDRGAGNKAKRRAAKLG